MSPGSAGSPRRARAALPYSHQRSRVPAARARNASSASSHGTGTSRALYSTIASNEARSGPKWRKAPASAGNHRGAKRSGADGQVAHVLEAVLADRVIAIDHKPHPAWALIQARPYHLCDRPHTY